jgi:hypothetical protein
MDSDLRQRLGQAFSAAQQVGNIRLTAPATVVIAILIDSIDDDPTGRFRGPGSLRDVQVRAIDNLPRYLTVISSAYQTTSIDALMVLNVLPSVLSEFCPPFEDPPDL